MNIQKMMQQAQQMQERLQKQMSEMRIEASAGGGMVAVTVNGHKHVQQIKIDPEVISKDDVEMLQDLIVAAVNDARHTVSLVTPYFVPDDAIALSLASAAWRGVRVRLLLPSKSDHWFLLWAGRSFYHELLEAGVDAFLRISDDYAPRAMRLLAQTRPHVVAGESGSAGVAALIALREHPDAGKALGLDADSRVLLIGSEGATDPAIYRKLVGKTPEEVAG